MNYSKVRLPFPGVAKSINVKWVHFGRLLQCNISSEKVNFTTIYSYNDNDLLDKRYSTFRRPFCSVYDFFFSSDTRTFTPWRQTYNAEIMEINETITYVSEKDLATTRLLILFRTTFTTSGSVSDILDDLVSISIPYFRWIGNTELTDLFPQIHRQKLQMQRSYKM